MILELGNPERGRPFIEAIAGAGLLLFGAEIAFVVIASVVGLVRRKDRSPRARSLAQVAHGLAALIAILAWASVLLITKINNHFLDRDPMVLYFGLARSYLPVLALGIAATAVVLLTAGLAVVATVAWLRGHGPVLSRVVFSLAAVAAVAYAVLLIRWDLPTLLFWRVLTSNAHLGASRSAV